MIVEPRDPIVKYAILEAHGFRCYVSKERIDIINGTIDHIIPQSHGDDSSIIDQYREKLDASFEVNHLYNLIPATWDINMHKGDKLYEINRAIYLMEQAKAKAPQIIKTIERLRKFKNIEKYLALISSYIMGSEDPKDEISKIVEMLSNDMGPFEEQKVVRDGHFLRSYSSVRLTASLPKPYEQCQSCLIEFRSMFISDCNITLNHKQIVDQLFVGLYSQAPYTKRGFIVGTYSQLSNIYYVQLGNNRFTLKENEVKELCDIVDEFADEYIKRFKFIENKWETDRFLNFDASRFTVRLVEVDLNQWRKILDFTWEFDYANGESEWHIFNKLNNRIMLYPQHTITTSLIPVETKQDTIWITWERYDTSFVQSTETWGAMRTYQWLTQELIPYVEYYYANVKPGGISLFKKNVKFDEYKEGFRLENYIRNSYTAVFRPKQLNEITTIVELRHYVTKLYEFYSSNPKVQVSNNGVNKAVAVLRTLLLVVTLSDYSCEYIGKKLFRSKSMKQSDLIASIASLYDEFGNINNQERKMHIYLAQVLRCIIEGLINKEEASMNSNVVMEMARLLGVIHEAYALNEYLQRINTI